MDKAKIHKEGQDKIVLAQEIKEGLYDRGLDFVDPEEDFRVTYVSSSKNHGSPYFRLYYSLKDYMAMSEERKTRYDILREQHHFAESPWHRKWEERVRSFTKIERYIRNPKTHKYKRADAFYEKYKLCIEFQHSYIANDFNERNSFYSELGFKIIWLYDLTKHEAKIVDNIVEILEDNARGFFRVAEENVDLSKYPVFIEVKGGRIFRVNKLYRKAIKNKKESTIRYFDLDKVYDNSDEFVDAIRECEEELFEESSCKSLIDLWKPEFDWMVVENIENHTIIKIFHQGDEMNRNYQYGNITYLYVTYSDEKQEYISNYLKFYSVSLDDEKKKCWKLLDFKIKE